MAIVANDLLVKLSIVTGAAGNAAAQADPNASLGKYISTSAWAGGVVHDLFDVVTGDDNAGSVVDYRCIFIHNSHATLTWTAPKVWLTSVVSGGADIAIGVDTTAAAAIGASAAQALQIANENTAPSGVSFSAPTTKGAGLSLGDIPPGQCKAVWIRRTATNSAPTPPSPTPTATA